MNLMGQMAIFYAILRIKSPLSAQHHPIQPNFCTTPSRHANFVGDVSAQYRQCCLFESTVSGKEKQCILNKKRPPTLQKLSSSSLAESRRQNTSRTWGTYYLKDPKIIHNSRNITIHCEQSRGLWFWKEKNCSTSM